MRGSNPGMGKIFRNRPDRFWGPNGNVAYSRMRRAAVTVSVTCCATVGVNFESGTMYRNDAPNRGFAYG